MMSLPHAAVERLRLRQQLAAHVRATVTDAVAARLTVEEATAYLAWLSELHAHHVAALCHAGGSFATAFPQVSVTALRVEEERRDLPACAPGSLLERSKIGADGPLNGPLVNQSPLSTFATRSGAELTGMMGV